MLVLLFFYCTGVVPGNLLRLLSRHCCIYCAIFASQVYFVGISNCFISYQCQVVIYVSLTVLGLQLTALGRLCCSVDG